jgi:FKBP-type peptidyl-prolyl cis-trans isomerase
MLKKNHPLMLATALLAGTICAFPLTTSASETDTYSMLDTPKDVNAVPADAESTASGLASRVLVAGTGSESPAAADTVTVHYSGWTTDGKMFDSSVKRGKPTSFPLNRVIKGWTEGLQLMVVGETRRFWIPAELAYGENPGGGRPGGLLVFDVELLEIQKAPEAPKVPEDVASVPANAEVRPSGLASRVLTVGTGSKHPGKHDMVTVHYSGWTTDGQMFDSSVMRGSPATFGLSQVIPGWTEGVQLMVEGEKRRFWIPAKLAYGENPRGGAPAGTLVFDVELLKVGR